MATNGGNEPWNVASPKANTPPFDICRAPAGGGYWLLTKKGYIYAYGAAAYYGGASATGKTFSAMSRRPQNDGYWLLATDGTVYGYGSAPVYTPNPVSGLQLPMSDITTSASGNGYWLCAQDGGVFAYGDAVFYGSGPGDGGRDSQWTLMKNIGRQPVLRVKNTWDVHWTFTTGTPGLEVSLKRDLSQAPNTFFGEGTDLESCTWRNTKYPNTRADPAPVFAGTELTLGSVHADVRKWEQEMHDRFSAAIIVDGKFTQTDSNTCRVPEIRWPRADRHGKCTDVGLYLCRRIEWR